MNLRTPRRRISPQTKRRCRAIKGFFRRALGSTSSQPDLRITSSIAVNVTDIKQKIHGLEQQLQEVSEQCHDISFHESNSAASRLSVVPAELRDGQRLSHLHITSKSKSKLSRINGEVSSRQPQIDSRKEEYACEPIACNDINKVRSCNKMNCSCKKQIHKSKQKYKVKEYHKSSLLNDRTKSTSENFVSAYSTSSFRSLDRIGDIYKCSPGYSGYGERNKYCTRRSNGRYKDDFDEYETQLQYKRNGHFNIGLEKVAKSPDAKRRSKELDPDFIADIISRQYNPIKMFGRKESDISQFTEPVCRDYDFGKSPNRNIREYPWSNGHGPRYSTKSTHPSDHSDMRRVCDVQPHRKKKYNSYRRISASSYNADNYDLVPVKEKFSPKLRRKKIDVVPHTTHYKEVPPSPRSQRPRLNLTAQQQHYAASEDTDFDRHPNIIKKNLQRYQTQPFVHEVVEEDYCPTETRPFEKYQNLVEQHDQLDIYPENHKMSCVQNTAKAEENATTIDPALNRTQDTTSSVEKTDRALCEIKDILQNFLHEIKKETSQSSSGHLEASANQGLNNISSPNHLTNIPNVSNSYRNSNPMECPVPPAAPPYLPTFGNACCPVMPVYRMGCIPNFAYPSTGYNCNNCVSKSYESNVNETSSNEVPKDTTSDTDDLIKEIYKFVSQSPTFGRKHKDFEKRNNKSYDPESKVLTSRSAGENAGYYRRDAKVGTPKLYYASKSCEAIRSKTLWEESGSETNASYSDTILEKFSTEPTGTQSTSPTELSTQLSEAEKTKRNKLAKVIRTLGLRKKNKKDVIEEVSESESTIENDVYNNDVYKKHHPYQQNLTNYVVHGQEYYRPPPVSPRREYLPDYRPPYNPDRPYHNPGMHQRPPEHVSPHIHVPYHVPQHPSAPPYPHAYEPWTPTQPHLPLCLKEVEVKSIACQSERKLSFFRKITQKMQQPADVVRENVPKNCSTQTAQMVKAKPGLFSWKNPHTKAMDGQINTMAYGYKTQKQLAEGDAKMRKAMLKKLLHKRNPFSPGNLIMKTLLGRDKASFGDPPHAISPRLFM